MPPKVIIVTSADFLGQIAAADENTDMKALATSIAQALGVSEDTIVILQGNIDDLTNKLDDANATITSLNTNIADLQNQITSIKTLLDEANADITSAKGGSNDQALQITNLQAELDEANENLEAALEQVKELGQKLTVREANAGQEGKLVIIEGKDYFLIGNRFNSPTGPITADDLAKDTARLEKMLQKGSGALVPAAAPTV